MEIKMELEMGVGMDMDMELVSEVAGKLLMEIDSLWRCVDGDGD